MVNNLIGSAEGKVSFKLTEPRTVRFGYNASPFKPRPRTSSCERYPCSRRSTAGGERVRIRQFFNCTVQNYYLRTLKWMEERQNKPLPPIEPELDIATGAISGFDINYHDVKLLAIDWEEKPLDEETLKRSADDDGTRIRLLNWGINDAARLPDADAAILIKPDNPAVKVEVWRRMGDAGGRGNSVLLRVTNTGDQPAVGTLKVDLKGLDVNVRQVWSEFTSAVALDGGMMENCESADQRRYRDIAFNAYDGELYYKLGKDQSRVFSIDRY